MPEKERFKPYAAAYLLLIKDDQILFMQRANTGYQDGNYGLVSGHFEGGETAKQCIIREAKEEAGITLSPEDLEVVHVMHRYSPTREYIDIYLRAERWSGEIQNMEPNKCTDLRWFNRQNLPKQMIPEVTLALQHIQEHIAYGEFGWVT